MQTSDTAQVSQGRRGKLRVRGYLNDDLLQHIADGDTRQRRATQGRKGEMQHRRHLIGHDNDSRDL